MGLPNHREAIYELWMCHLPTSSQFTQCIYIQKKYTLIIYPSIAVLVSIMAHGCDSFRGCIPNLRGLFDGRWGCTQQNPDRFSPLGKPRPCSWAWGKTPRDRWIDLNPTTEGGVVWGCTMDEMKAPWLSKKKER